MEIAKRNIIGLPYLRRVAYLESHGTEWIDTSVVVTEDVGFKIKHGKFGGDTVICGVNSSVGRMWINSATVSFYIRHWDSAEQYGYSFIQPSSYPVICSCNFLEDRKVSIFKLDGTVASKDILETDMVTETGLSFWLFGCNKNGVLNLPPSSARIYEAEISNGLSIVRDLIPVLDCSGRPAMYDKVSGRFFYNQGAGEFDWGELQDS